MCGGGNCALCEPARVSGMTDYVYVQRYSEHTHSSICVYVQSMCMFRVCMFRDTLNITHSSMCVCSEYVYVQSMRMFRDTLKIHTVA